MAESEKKEFKILLSAAIVPIIIFVTLFAIMLTL